MTSASELLRAVLDERGVQARLARLLGVRLELVGRWSRGERRPMPPTRFRLQDVLTIDARLWDEAAPASGSTDLVAFAKRARRRLLKAVAAEALTFRGDRVA